MNVHTICDRGFLTIEKVEGGSLKLSVSLVQGPDGRTHAIARHYTDSFTTELPEGAFEGDHHVRWSRGPVMVSRTDSGVVTIETVVTIPE